MEYEPLVSIIIPVYNVEKYIKKTIESVIGQTYEKLELIIVDDGSTDASIDIAQKALDDSAITYQIVHQNNRGVGCARNIGMELAKGEWLFFLDSDDILVPNTVKTMIEATKQEKVDMVFCGYKTISSLQEIESYVGETIFLMYTSEQLQKDFLLRETIVLAPGTLWRRELLISRQIFFEKIAWSEDQHFVWRALRDIGNAIHVKETLYYYVQHQGSIMHSTTVDKMIESYSVICQLESVYKDSQTISKFIVPRWVMGTLNSASSLSDFVEWKRLMYRMEGRRKMKLLLGFPNAKVRSCALLGILSPKLYYWFARYKK